MLHLGKLLIIPHTFVCIKQVICDTFEWVSFKTHAATMFNRVVGKESLFRALPQDLILSSYKNLTREEVRLLELGEELSIIHPIESIKTCMLYVSIYAFESHMTVNVRDVVTIVLASPK